jgi:hypothetical protein
MKQLLTSAVRLADFAIELRVLFDDEHARCGMLGCNHQLRGCAGKRATPMIATS